MIPRAEARRAMMPGLAGLFGLAAAFWIAAAIAGEGPGPGAMLTMAAAGLTLGASAAAGWLALGLIASGLLDMAGKALRRALERRA